MFYVEQRGVFPRPLFFNELKKGNPDSGASILDMDSLRYSEPTVELRRL